jgi:hypothetical protein
MVGLKVRRRGTGGLEENLVSDHLEDVKRSWKLSKQMASLIETVGSLGYCFRESIA